MSGKNKTHNSIIFLTTLSVYLSLSLLGAAPQVLAYAATTRDFDIQTEIEYKDDFDNQPDNETASAKEKSGSSAGSFKNYSKQVQNFVDVSFSIDSIDPSLFEKDSRNFRFGLEKPDGNLFLNHSSFFEIDLSGFFANNVFQTSPAYKTNSKLEKAAYDGTQINSENNQVFIVTRLPRAAIDSSIY